MDSSIVIPVFNRVDLTAQCLSHLKRTIDPARTEVIVVDNGSVDGTQKFLAAQENSLRVIRNEENLGFARGCNQGARVAGGRYVVFLNNDTIPLPGWIEPMLGRAEAKKETAIVGSKLLFPDGTIQHAGVLILRADRTPVQAYKGVSGDAPLVNRRRECRAVTAACMLVRRSVFDEMGGFDEEYENGFEDVDLCLRVWSRGHRVVYEPESVLYHFEGQTPGRRDADLRNLTRFAARFWHPGWVDEDLFHFEDGMRSLSCWQDGKPHSVYRKFRDPEERARWERAARIQLLLPEQPLAELRTWLEPPEEWPLEVTLLDWAADLCKAEGFPDLAARFRARADPVRRVEAPPEGLVCRTRGVQLG